MRCPDGHVTCTVCVKQLLENISIDLRCPAVGAGNIPCHKTYHRGELLQLTVSSYGLFSICTWSLFALLGNLLSRFYLQDQDKMFEVFKANTARETALLANREIADLKVALNAAVVVAPGMVCFLA